MEMLSSKALEAGEKRKVRKRKAGNGFARGIHWAGGTFNIQRSTLKAGQVTARFHHFDVGS